MSTSIKTEETIESNDDSLSIDITEYLIDDNSFTHNTKHYQPSPNSNMNRNGFENRINDRNDSLPPLPMSEWIDGPLLMCIHPQHKSFMSTNYDKQIAIPINTVFDFESSVFKGQAIFQAIGFPNTNTAYFKNRNRTIGWTIQGQFKRKICFNEFYTGQIFSKPYSKLPAKYLINTCLKIMKKLAPALKVDLYCDSPYLVSPLCSCAQQFNMCLPGDEVPLPIEPIEDLTLLGPEFKGMQWQQRKTYFHNLENLKKYYFDTRYVYTMTTYTHMLTLPTYTFNICGTHWSIAKYISSPIVIACMIINDDNVNEDDDEQKEGLDVNDDGSGMGDYEYLYHFLLWHENIIAEQENANKSRSQSLSHSYSNSQTSSSSSLPTKKTNNSLFMKMFGK